MKILMQDVATLGQKSGQVLIWNGKESIWKSISERLRKDRKEKLERLCSKLEKK
jgi:hypothetical protein